MHDRYTWLVPCTLGRNASGQVGHTWAMPPSTKSSMPVIVCESSEGTVRDAKRFRASAVDAVLN